MRAPDKNLEIADKVRVKLDTPDANLEGQLRAIQDVQMVAAGSYDVLVQRADSAWRIYDQSGTLVQAVPVDQTEKVLARIRGSRP